MEGGGSSVSGSPSLVSQNPFFFFCFLHFGRCVILDRFRFLFVVAPLTSVVAWPLGLCSKARFLAS